MNSRLFFFFFSFVFSYLSPFCSQNDAFEAKRNRFRGICFFSKSFLRKSYPITNCLRHQVILHYPYKTNRSRFTLLSHGSKKMSGRNSSGRITVRHRGSQLCKKVVKCITRVYSYMRYIPFYVCSFEHCQGVRHLVSLILFINGLYLYVPTLNVFEKKGFSFFYSVRGGVIPFEGGSYPLKLILIGSLISNIELKPLSGASLSRSAGSFSVVIQRNLYDCWLRLSSGVIRIVSFFCSAILGSMGCSMIKLSCFGSAGKLRLVGFKPKVRGVAMNPIDHPHGGGEGRSSGGRPSVSPWSFYTKGKKTRNPRKSLSYVVIMSGDLNSLKKKKVRL